MKINFKKANHFIFNKNYKRNKRMMEKKILYFLVIWKKKLNNKFKAIELNSKVKDLLSEGSERKKSCSMF